MAASIKDAMRKAFATKAEVLSTKATAPAKTIPKETKRVQVTLGSVETHHPNKPVRERSARTPLVLDLDKILAGAKDKAPTRIATAAVAPLPASTDVQHALAVKKTALPDCVIRLKNGIKPTCLIKDEEVQQSYCAPAKSGIKEQAHAGSYRDERDVVIGLDFGTSSVKVIIADRALTKAFAVPFSSAEGIGRYLLPSRLFETEDTFMLKEGDTIYRDLKLSLMADPENIEAQVRVTAFLALVIRHARGWLLSEHRETYLQTNIQWKLVVGLPAAHHLQSEHQTPFKKVAQAAWLVAAVNKLELIHQSVDKALSRAEQLIAGALPSRPVEEAEISIVPELAAQIYGYVASNRFNRNAPNLYLMVDVGAGTVDSSLFRVEHSAGGKKKFTFFTSQVQPNGVMNLHRARIHWWEKVIAEFAPSMAPDTSCLQSSKRSTDRLTSIPGSFKDYFSGIKVDHREDVPDPDQAFFSKLLVQVRGNTLWKTWKDKLLTRNDLSGVPMFLCGGGTRMQYYRDIEQEISNLPGYTWLKTEARPLEVPKSLIAPGLPQREYDRLSVAFGLSFLEVSSVLKATPIPQITPTEVTNWRDNYTDKDQC